MGVNAGVTSSRTEAAIFLKRSFRGFCAGSNNKAMLALGARASTEPRGRPAEKTY
jgi:hypothetical protein